MRVGSLKSEVKSIGVVKASFEHSPNIGILYCCRYPLLVIDLLVDLAFIDVCPISHYYLDFVFGGQELAELHLYHQPDHLGHRAVRNGGGKVNLDFRIIFHVAPL